MNDSQELRAEDVRVLRQHARSRLEREGPRLRRLLTLARRRLAVSSRGLSEQIEALAQHIVSVHTKIDRMQAARGEDLRALATELDDKWRALEERASRIRSTLRALEGRSVDEMADGD